MKDDRLFAVVNIEIIGNRMLAENKAVLKSLHADTAERLMIALIGRRNQPSAITGIRLKLFLLRVATDVARQAKVAMFNDEPTGIFEVGSR